LWQFVKSVNGKKKECYRGKASLISPVNFVEKPTRGITRMFQNFAMSVVRSSTCAKDAEVL
jgi:hypothetical protein